MELTSEGLRAEVNHLPEGLAQVLPQTPMKAAFHGGNDVGGVLGVLARTVLLNQILVRDTDITDIATTLLADTDIGLAHVRVLQIKEPGPKHCPRGCVLEPGNPFREPPADLRYRKTLNMIQLNARLIYVENSKGKKRHPQKRYRVMSIHVRIPLFQTFRLVHTTSHQSLHAPLLPARDHHQVHHHLFHHLTTLPLIVFDLTYLPRWTNTLTRPTTLAWTSHR